MFCLHFVFKPFVVAFRSRAQSSDDPRGSGWPNYCWHLVAEIRGACKAGLSVLIYICGVYPSVIIYKLVTWGCCLRWGKISNQHPCIKISPHEALTNQESMGCQVQQDVDSLSLERPDDRPANWRHLVGRSTERKPWFPKIVGKIMKNMENMKGGPIQYM